jgi:hypothetical protein
MQSECIFILIVLEYLSLCINETKISTRNAVHTLLPATTKIYPQVKTQHPTDNTSTNYSKGGRDL